MMRSTSFCLFFCVQALAATAQEQPHAIVPPLPPVEGESVLQEAGQPSTNPIFTPMDESPVTSSYVPGDGLTVSLLNDTSRLKLFGQFSAIGIFSTDRPFSAGLPLLLLLLPPSPYGLNTNTFDLHARQSNVGASFSGSEVFGMTPGAFFLGFIQNDNLTSDAYGLLPYQA